MDDGRPVGPDPSGRAGEVDLAQVEPPDRQTVEYGGGLVTGHDVAEPFARDPEGQQMQARGALPGWLVSRPRAVLDVGVATHPQPLSAAQPAAQLVVAVSRREHI